MCREKVLKAEEVLKELNEIYGINNSKSIIVNYSKYLTLTKETDLKLGNYNIIIRNSVDTEISTKLINIIWKLQKINNVVKRDYHYITLDEISDFDNNNNDNKEKEIRLEKVEEKLWIIDTEKMDKTLSSIKSNIKKIMDKFQDKIYIIIDNTEYFSKSFMCKLGDLFSWEVEVEEMNEEDKINYIKKYLDTNSIKYDDNFNYIELLAKKDYENVKSELFNLVIECKSNNIEKVTDEIIEEQLGDNFKTENKKYKKSKGRAIDELNDLVGIEEVKRQVEQIINYLKVLKRRDDELPMLHMCFLGNPRNRKNDSCKNNRKIIRRRKDTF